MKKKMDKDVLVTTSPLIIYLRKILSLPPPLKFHQSLEGDAPIKFFEKWVG